VAVLDPGDNVVVISVVYDGAPLAGKTTSVKALARSVGRSVYTPEEQEGRTAYFDWVEYTGGRFDGLEIRCQILSVPSQLKWIDRRVGLLDGADVVVFVGDTTASGWAGTLAQLRDLRMRLDARPPPPVGVIFQANKRDQPDALPMAEVRADLAETGWRIAVVESVASEGEGIREAFVFAVRLALDRVREQQMAGQLPRGRARYQDGQELLDHLRRTTGFTVPRPGPRSTGWRSSGPSSPRGCRRLQLHCRLRRMRRAGSSGPPVDGRLILHRVAEIGLRTRVTSVGDCVAGLGSGWRVHSHRDAVFADIEEGRSSLIAWARQHAATQSFLSRPRCIVLSESGDGRWRLWQIVSAAHSLREVLSSQITRLTPDRAARELAEAARLLCEAQRQCARAQLPVTCSLDTIGKGEHDSPVYIGLMPSGGGTPRHSDPVGFARELAPIVAGGLSQRRAEVVAAIRSLRSTLFTFSGGDDVSRSLAELLS
jgi:hypothetical protein